MYQNPDVSGTECSCTWAGRPGRRLLEKLDGKLLGKVRAALQHQRLREQRQRRRVRRRQQQRLQRSVHRLRRPARRLGGGHRLPDRGSPLRVHRRQGRRRAVDWRQHCREALRRRCMRGRCCCPRRRPLSARITGRWLRGCRIVGDGELLGSGSGCVRHGRRCFGWRRARSSRSRLLGSRHGLLGGTRLLGSGRRVCRVGRGGRGRGPRRPPRGAGPGAVQAQVRVIQPHRVRQEALVPRVLGREPVPGGPPQPLSTRRRTCSVQAGEAAMSRALLHQGE